MVGEKNFDLIQFIKKLIEDIAYCDMLHSKHVFVDIQINLENLHTSLEKRRKNIPFLMFVSSLIVSIAIIIIHFIKNIFLVIVSD